MPIDYNDYPPDFKATSNRIRFERAEGKCERCGAPHGQIIARSDDNRYMLDTGETFDANSGEYLGMSRGSEFPAIKFVLIVLTTAHQDHDVSNNTEENLIAFCQRCHLNHDREDNARRRKYDKPFNKQVMFLENFKRGVERQPVTLPNGHKTEISHQLKGRAAQVFHFYIKLPSCGGWMPFDIRPAAGITSEDKRMWGHTDQQLSVVAEILSTEATAGFISTVLTGKEH